MDLATYFRHQIERVNQALDYYLPSAEEGFGVLHEAMRYSVFAGGKRLRPVLAISVFESCGGQDDAILPPACAIELIHTYSLIHDDLPAMDNDALRRGKPTNHIVYGDAVAILAGDALLTLAFQLATKVVEFGDRYQTHVGWLIDRIADASGNLGMIGGQILDLEGENKKLTVPELQKIHHHKTGRLLAVPLEIGARLAGANDDVLDQFHEIGMKLGLAFQIADDILDIEGSEAELGKPIGSDEANQKATYPALLGLNESKNLAAGLIDECKNSLTSLPYDTTILQSIADYVITRKK